MRTWKQSSLRKAEQCNVCEDNLGLQRESPDVSGKPARRFLSWEVVHSPLASGLTDRTSCIKTTRWSIIIVIMDSWRFA